MSTHKAFTDKSNEWWDPKGPFWTLHAINPIRLSFILEKIASGRALDVGCGGGILSESLLPYFKTTGIDIDQNLIAIAKGLNSECDYHHSSIQALKEHTTETFDLITCLEVLEHTKQPKALVEDIASLLNPNGYAIFSTLNRNLISFLGAIVAAEHILQLLPKHTHEYQYFIKPNELIQWASTTGLSLVDIKGISYNPFYKSFSLSTHTTINYIVCFKKKP